MNAGWFLKNTRKRGRIGILLIVGLLPAGVFAQTAFTWQQIVQKFEATNPMMKASQLNIDASRAAEITAYVRPNPDFGLSADGTQLTPYYLGIYLVVCRHSDYTKHQIICMNASISVSCGGTMPKNPLAIAEATYLDQERGLLFNSCTPRSSTSCRAKAYLQNARENLVYWDRELEVSRTRFQAGDLLAQVDLGRLELPSRSSSNQIMRRRQRICGRPRSRFRCS